MKISQFLLKFIIKFEIYGGFLTFLIIKGVGGGPGVQIMENEFECLADKGDQDRHFAEEFVIKYCS